MNNCIFKKIISNILISAILSIGFFGAFDAKILNANNHINPLFLQKPTDADIIGASVPVETNFLRDVPKNAADQDVVGALSAQDNTKIGEIKAKTAGILNTGSLGNNMVPVDDKKNNQKERTLDSIWMLMAKTTIRQITTSTVNWINNGFQGGPAYVTDVRGFLLDLADAQTANFIEGTALELLCSPWRMDIKIALSLPSAGFREDVRCTLSDIVANIDDFINGDFSQGGWAGWIELTTQNNPYRDYLTSASELNARIEQAQGEEMKLLDWGNGFLSYKKCEEGPRPTTQGGGPGAPVNCKIVTPGSVIESQLANVLGSGVRQLELADEFNEIVNALMSQLIVRVFNSANNGLRGLSEESRGTPSYTSRLLVTEDTASIQNIIASSEIEFGRVINEELIYLTIKQNSLQSVEAVETQLLSLVKCYEDKLADRSLNLTNDDMATALERRNSASSTIDTLIIPLKNILISEINTESVLIIKLDSLLTDIQNSTNPVQLQIPTSILESMKRQDILKGPYVFAAEQERAVISSEMGALAATTQAQIAECQVFPSPLENE